MLTDGVIAKTYTANGRLKVHIHRIYETKSGSGAAKELGQQAEWNYERIKELGMSLHVTQPNGTVGWVKFAPEDISMPPRTSQASVVHGFVPSNVQPTISQGSTRAYTPRALPGITESELQDAALMILRNNAASQAE